MWMVGSGHVIATSSRSDLARLAASVGLVILSCDLGRPVGGLYLYCPARRLRLLLVNRLTRLGCDGYQGVVVRGLAAVALGRRAEVIEA